VVKTHLQQFSKYTLFNIKGNPIPSVGLYIVWRFLQPHGYTKYKTAVRNLVNYRIYDSAWTLRL